MARIMYIKSEKEIPLGEKFVLVRFGRVKMTLAHSHGITAIVRRDSGIPSQRELRAFHSTVEDLKSVADRDGIPTLYVVEPHPNRDNSDLGRPSRVT